MLKLPKLTVEAGSIVLGMMANWALFGILLVQTYLYFIAFGNDRRLQKLTVLALISLETTQTMTLALDLIQRVTMSYVHPDNAFQEAGKLWVFFPLMIGLIASIVQGFYCYRIGLLTQSKYAVAAISILSLGQFAGAMAVTVQVMRTNMNIILFIQTPTLTSICIWGSCSFACDTVIAVIMTYHLRNRDPGFENAHNIIVRLIRLSIEAGCATALSAGTVLILVNLPHHPFYYFISSSIVAKMYSNSLMAILNSRIKPISNAPPSAPPLWNESVQELRQLSLFGERENIVFRRSSGTSLNLSSG